MTEATLLLREVGWHRTCLRMRRSDIPCDVPQLQHTAAPRLDRIRRNGVPVVLKNDPWTPEILEERCHRGPHKSAFEYQEFLREEFLDFVRKGFWMVLPYSKVKNLPGLRLSPLGVVPQDGRRPRVIVDYSFYGLNAETVPLSSPKSMQFGRTTKRLQQMVASANPRYGPVYMYKIDISDGFYRVPVTTSGAIKLGVVLPPLVGTEPLVAFPLVLPMGWAESPPFFCEFTETACDLTNQDFHARRTYPEHPLESRAGAMDAIRPDEQMDAPNPHSHQRTRLRSPLTYMDVYVDDFCGAGQENPTYLMRHQRRALLHNIDRVFRPSNATDSKFRKEPISLSKLDKGDASFNTKKDCLGWDFDGKAKEFHLTAKRKKKIDETLHDTLHQRRIGRQAYQSVLGQLRSLAVGVPGLSGQFSRLQTALSHHTGRLPIEGAVRTDLELAKQLIDDPARTSLYELVPGTPYITGASDASGEGMGGVFFAPSHPPTVWRTMFPTDVQENMVSRDNPHGKTSICDLEMAGVLTQQAAIASIAPVRHETIHHYCDNMAAVAWTQKGSTTTTSATANLLQAAASLRKQHKTHLHIAHLAGTRNKMADDASRLWHLTDPAFLTHFDTTFPQAKKWQLLQPPSEVVSRLTYWLSTRRSPKELVPNAYRPVKSLGESGLPFATTSASTPASANSRILSGFFSSSANNGVMAQSPPVANKSEAVLPKMRSAWWARRSPNWGPETPASATTIGSTFASNANMPDGVNPIRQPSAGKLFHVRYSLPSRRQHESAALPIFAQPRI